MVEPVYFTSLQFQRYKAFRRFSVSLRSFNVLVGPNNSGKSTIIGAFRILAEGIRKAKAKKPELVNVNDKQVWGYKVDLTELPISIENMFSDYDDSEAATISFRLSNGNSIRLVIPEVGVCFMVCETAGLVPRSPAQFRKSFPVSVGFVPVLGPVENVEPVYMEEAARKALSTHRASRNFRNIWHHYGEDFELFRELVQSTWPGMDIQRPELIVGEKRSELLMFCPEGRYPREIYWAGFGFQVWCQMLTYMIKARESSLFLIDEPDIYLHSDLQRQLVSLLRNLGPDILIATHSTEIISEAEPDELLIINKSLRAAKRIRDPHELEKVFTVLGSNLNPTLTQLAKTKRAVFVEGKDFQILSGFARKYGKEQVGNRSDFAVIPLGGYRPQKVKDFSQGVEVTLGAVVSKAVILDRDYRSPDEIQSTLRDLEEICQCVFIHNRKELENYLLEVVPLEKAIQDRIRERQRRVVEEVVFEDDVTDLLDGLTNDLKSDIQGQYLASRTIYESQKYPGHAPGTINAKLLSEFDKRWSNFDEKMALVPGKKVLSMLNTYLQENYNISLTVSGIIAAFRKIDIPQDVVELIEGLDDFSSMDTTEV